MVERAAGRPAVLAVVAALGVLVLGVGATLGVGAEQTAEHETAMLESVEWEGTPSVVVPSESGFEDSENSTAGNNTQVVPERGANGSDFDDEVTRVDIDELGTLDEPGIYQTDVTGIDTVGLAVFGPGGGGAGYVSDGNGGVKDGGAGGYVDGTWDVSDFTEITVTVGEGGGGGDALLGEGSGGSGYFKGGAGGFDDDDTAGGGGGGTTVVEGIEPGGDEVLLVAAGGGGGGAAWNQSGGIVGEPTVESGGGGGAPGGSGGSTGTIGGSDGSDGEDSDGIIPNDIGAPGGDAGDTSANPGGTGGWWVNSTYAESWSGNVGGGASGGDGGASFDGELGDPGDDGSVDVTTPNVVVQSTSAPTQIQPGESLTVSYTLAETNGIAAEESFVDLTINGTLEEFDSSVSVPASGTTSGELTFTDTNQYIAMNWCIELFDYGDQSCGTTSIPDISIQSVSGPGEIAPGEDLTVDYTLQNNGGPGEESFVDLYVDGSLEESDSNVFVPEGGTTSGSIIFSDTGSYSDGDTIDWSVELFDFGDTAGGTTDVVEDPGISIQSVNAPDQIGINEDLSVDYTLANSGGDGTESAVSLLVGGTAEDTDSNVFVPGGGTSSGTLTYSDVGSDFGYGDTIGWTVELADSGDTASGSTDIEAAPPDFQVSIQSTNSPVVVGNALSVTAEIQNTGGTSDTQTITLSTGGLGSDSTSVTLQSGASTTKTLQVGTRSGDAGEYTAEVASDNSSDTTSVSIIQGATFDVTITSTNEPVEGQPLSVDVLVENTGDTEDTQTIELVVDGLGTDSTSVTLGGGSSTTVTLSLDTSVGDEGQYTADASSENDTDSTTVTVLGDAEFNTTITSTNEPVSEGDTLLVEATIENTGDVQDSQVVELAVPGVGTDSTAIDLLGGGSTQQSFTVDTGGGDAGTYTAEVASEDNTDSVSVTILEASQFAVAITGTNEPLEGGTLEVTAEITNTGGSQDAQVIDMTVDGLGSDSTALELTGGGSATRTFSVGTTTGDAGNYTAEVASNDDSATAGVSVLAPAEFQVSIQSATEPVAGEPLVVDTELTNTGGVEGTQTLTLDAGGLGTNTTTVTLGGGSSTTVPLSVETDPADIGTYSLDVSSNDDTDSTQVTILEPAQFDLIIADTNNPLAGERLNVTAEIFNTGGVADTQTVQLNVSGLGTDTKAVTIDSGSSTILTLSVETGSNDAGTYTAEVASEDDAGTATVTVQETVNFSVAITGVSEPVEGADLVVTAAVQNSGDVDGTQTVELDAGPLGANTTAVTLGASESTTVALSVGTAPGDAGNYTATVTSDDDTASTEVEVLAQAAFAVSVASADEPVEGDPLSVDISVENTGAVTGTQVVTLDAGPLGTDNTSVTLGGGNSTMETLSVATRVGDAGTYAVTVTSEDDQNTTTVDVLQRATFGISIDNTGEPVEGDPLDVGVLVENTGDIEGTQTVTLDAGALGTSNAVVTLGAGESATETLSVGTSGGDAGEYTATVSTDDDADSQNVTVLAAPAFGIEILSTTVSGGVLDVTYGVENTGDVADTQNVTLSVDGTSEAQREYTLSGNESVQETLAYDIVAGDAPDVTVEVASADDSVTRTVSIAPADLTLSILDADTSVVAGEDLSVTVEAANTGEEPLSETVELLDIGGTTVDDRAVDLTGGETTQETLVWTTEPGDAGTGEITVDSAAAEAQTRTVEVLAPPSFAVEITGANAPVAGEDLSVTVAVENVGDINDTQTVALDVGALGADSRQVTLTGGESTTETLSVGTSTGDAGSYTATVESDNDTATQQVSVLQEAAFAVTIIGVGEPVEGEALTVTAEIANTGETEDSQTVTLDVPGLGTNSTNVTLGGGASTNRTLTVGTAAGDAGEYTATIESDDDSASVNVTVLAQAEFAVDILDAPDIVAGENLLVTAAVENTGDVDATQTVTLDAPGLGTNSTDVTLAAGDSTEVVLPVLTSAGDAGSYTATVTSADDTDSTQVTVLEPPTFEVGITDATEPVEGGTLVVTATVENTGAVQGTHSVTLDVPGLGSDTTTVVLGSGNTTEETFSVSTAAGDAGGYTATVSTADDSASANVTVLEQAAFAVEIVDTGEPVAGEDLTVTVNVTNTGDESDTQAVELDVGSLGSDDTAVTLSGGESTAETLSVSTRSGDAGSYTATVTSADDSTSTNVTVLEPAAFDVAITGTGEPVEGEDLSVTVTVENTGDAADTQNVTLDVGTLGGNSTQVALSGGESTAVTLSVPTGVGDADSYTAEVTSNDDSDTQTVTVLQEASFVVEIDATNEPVAGERLSVTAGIQNTGDAEDSQTVTLDVPGLGTNSTNVTLGAGASTSTTLTVGTAAGDAGGYTATAGTDDDSASVNVTVLAQAEFAVDIVDAPDVVVGEDLTVTATIQNTGDVADTQNVTLDAGALGSDQVSLSLAGGASTTETFAVSTASGDAGSYAATVSSDDDADSTEVTVLAAPEFTVEIVGTTVSGSVLDVTYSVENTGDVADTQNVTLSVDGTSEGQREYTLGGNESVQETFAYDIVAGDAPEVTVEVASADDSDSLVVSIASGDLALSILDADTSVVAGEDLSVTVEATNTGDEPLSETVELLDIGGTTVDDQQVSLPGGGTAQATLVWATESGDAGTGDITVDSNSTDALTRTVEVLAPSFFAVEVLDASTPVAGENLTLTVGVENTGDINDTQTVTLDVPGVGTDSAQTTLAGGESTTATLALGTGAGDAGSYTATVESDNDTATREVSVLQQAAFAVTITGASKPVAGENLTVTATVTNTGGAEETQSVTLTVPGLGSNETSVTLAAGASTAETLAVGTSEDDVGEYTATVASEDTQDSTNVTVLDTAAFEISVVEAPAVVAGDALAVTAAVENTGGVTGTQQVTLAAAGLGENSTQVTVPAGDSTEVTLSVLTESGDAGNYTATVTSADDTDSTQVTVLEPPTFEVDITDATEPVEGGPLVVTAVVENVGETGDTQTVTLDVPGLGSDTTTTVLGGGNATEETFSVATEPGDAGEYTATVSSADDQDSTAVTVLGKAAFAVDIVETGEPVAGEDLTVTVNVTNTGDEQATQAIELGVGDLGSNDTAVTLAGGESVEETLAVATAAGDAGAYTATVSTGDDTDTTEVTVLEPAAFMITITGTNKPVTGENLMVTASITNTGDVEDTQTVTLDASSLGSDSVEVTLGASSSTVKTLAVATGSGDAGSYTAEVATEDDTDTTNVTVLEPGSVGVTLTDTSEPVAGEPLAVTATVTNTGEAAVTRTITLDVGPLGENSTTVALDGGESTATTLSVDTNPGQAGEYTATVASPTDSDATTVTVLEASQFTVDIVEMNDTVLDGKSTNITVEVQNVGQGPGVQPLAVAVETHNSTEVTVELGAGESTQRTMALSMASQQLGTYNVTATTEDDTDQDIIKVTLPTIPGADGPPQDMFGDGYHEDVDGDGEFDIFDVQTFFKNFDLPEIQEHGWAFDYNNDGDVTIFDVQALFNRL